ncbi:MAG: hypothetical protein SFX18_20330 [Pirellulales bacterium]|nr:hypothetical protein [Pirellulales bacterium]
MSLEALCPNGHRIQCPDESAGRMARCPRCATPFRIPGDSALPKNGSPPPDRGPPPHPAAPAFLAVDAPHIPLEGAVATDAVEPVTESQAMQITHLPGSSILKSESSLTTLSAGHAPAFAAPAGASSNATPGPNPAGGSGKLPPDAIVFLCPNGHKLNGPAKLAGRLGQCPHCQARFQIPSLEVLRAVQAAEAGPPVQENDISNQGKPIMAEIAVDTEPVPPSMTEPNAAGDLADLFAAVRADEERQILQRGTAASGIGKGTAIPVLPSPSLANPPPTAKRANPLAELMYKLWEEREHGGIIELHLEGGAVLLPDWFERKLSVETHGLFASQAADGTVTMTIVPWDTVQKVIIRGVVGLPDGMFE